MYIRYIMLHDFKNKNDTGILIFVTKESLLTVKGETAFQSVILVVYHSEIKPDQGAHRTSIKTV